jgi:hypothetical protein
MSLKCWVEYILSDVKFTKVDHKALDIIDGDSCSIDNFIKHLTYIFENPYKDLKH